MPRSYDLHSAKNIALLGSFDTVSLAGELCSKTPSDHAEGTRLQSAQAPPFDSTPTPDSDRSTQSQSPSCLCPRHSALLAPLNFGLQCAFLPQSRDKWQQLSPSMHLSILAGWDAADWDDHTSRKGSSKGTIAGVTMTRCPQDRRLTEINQSTHPPTQPQSFQPSIYPSIHGPFHPTLHLSMRLFPNLQLSSSLSHSYCRELCGLCTASFEDWGWHMAAPSGALVPPLLLPSYEFNLR